MPKTRSTTYTTEEDTEEASPGMDKVLKQLSAISARLDAFEKSGEKETNSQTTKRKVVEVDLEDKSEKSRFAPSGPSKKAKEDDAPSINASSVAAALSQLMAAGSSTQGESMLSEFLIDGFTLDAKIKTKIWEGEYVELASLLPQREDSSQRSQINVDRTHGFSITPAKPRKVQNFTEWLKAFNVYAAVYSDKYHEAAPQMFSYINRIQDMYSDQSLSGFTWRVYDEQFRKLKHLLPNLDWHLKITQVLDKAKEAANTSTRFSNPPAQSYGATQRKNFKGKGRGKVTSQAHGQSSSNKTKGSTRVRGTCWNNNDGLPCAKNPCNLRHACSSCGADGHLAKACKVKGNASGDGTN